MYAPAHFSAGDAEVRELLAGCDAADLVTSTPQGLIATFLPILFDPSVGEHGAILAHVARNNDQWREPAAGESLFIVHGPDAYVSPSWYPSKREHGRAVPTWNYLTAHVYGRLVVHDDPAWVESMVRRLTERHEDGRAEPWSVDDALPAYIAGQLRAIVGLELVISRVEAKAKMSQNRPEADRAGVVEGYLAEGNTTMAEAVRDA
ncbi:FMN-binding negative transcriptional regulator [Actinomadura sp. BRA 177]|uniref:FMN-binding negative transcriptional regulator n=1 Tax=Actinomadura sp. BRA 177 TaxID=2745202 RepID=UPI0015950437|nr:FMN-binding negative transcriptional regulator [Actinomadura sp. BRA 177]NVI86139.1 FMN-binding negative transcriptional regulator [Actinomadura sp. BRA 177]